MTRTATCCCKTCVVTFTGDPVLNGICHCDDCKRRTGSAFGWSAYFKDEQLGEHIGEYTQYEPSGEPGQVRSFCRKCGSTLYWFTPSRPDEIGVAGGAFIDHPLPRPQLSAQDRTRCIWFDLPDGMEAG